ncbi:MAG TPA: hypothetical protein VNZ01_08590 [Solirubrobacteraceae bacterium]|jgi:hypothetical protein|nr:hypothetical protein [Solirubrobacteraceae bacterium]
MGRTRAVIGLSAVGAGVVALIVALAAAGGISPRRASGPFAWLRPASPPVGWHVARTPDGAALAYPPGWTTIKTDPGTASAALRGSGGRIDGYLNVTPKQGAETLANWGRFRPQKNRDEGARKVRLLAATGDAHFRSARGSCVIDAYTTSLITYEEIACLVSGGGSSDVVIAAAPARLWQERSSAVLERAVSSFAV